MFLSYLFIGIAALLPVITTSIFYFLNKYTPFSKLNYCLKQMIYGIVFGGLAIVGTHWGIDFYGAQANARDASVIAAGLIFGFPAGIIAGAIGGIERFLAPYLFGIGAFTQISCSISTFLAGTIAGLLKKYLFENRRPGCISGFFIGFVIETFHLLMVFITNAKEYQKAFNVVKSCSAPMLIANAISVLLSILIYKLLTESKEKRFEKPDFRSLSNKIQYRLTALIAVAFVLSSAFIYMFQNKMYENTTNNLLSYAISDVTSDIDYKSDNYILNVCKDIKDDIENKGSLVDNDFLVSLEPQYHVSEINIIDQNGVITFSTDSSYVGVDLNNSINEYVAEFLDLIKDEETNELVQDFRQISENEDISRKYAGVKFSNGIIQIGYGYEDLQLVLSMEMKDITQNTRINETGGVVIFDSNGSIISSRKDLNKATISQIFTILNNKPYNEMIITDLEGEQYIFIQQDFIGYKVVSLIPKSDAQLSRNIAIIINTFLEIIIYGLIFLTLYLLIEHLFNKKLTKTNDSLAKITNGDLEEVVEGGNTTEFIALADGINNTVDALKGYIDEANKRIDKELAFAKAIQSNVLPSDFPAFPLRKEFDIYASMHPTKEVGGDFYDFYFSGRDLFHITIADVSGKGIPAALFMMRAKAILKSLTESNIEINEAFEKGNNSLCDGNEAGMFVTSWSSTIDLSNGIISFANGGHNPPLIKHKDGKFEFLKSKANFVLGTFEGLTYQKNEIKLDPGDTIYLYTDGVTEGVNKLNEQFGDNRLIDALNSKEFTSCKEICDFIYNECVKFADGADQFDDITMLAFKYNGK